MKILVVCPNPNDATSYYRAAGPLLELTRTHDVELLFDEAGEWPTLRMVDVAFFQRPHVGTHLELLKKCKDHKIPVWTDYDDLLTAVPDSNPTHKHFWNPEFQKVIWAFIEHSDIITAPTELLANILKDSGAKKTQVIPNAWDDIMYPTKQNSLQHSFVAWRGSQTHDEDLHGVLKELKQLDLELKPQWALFGDPYWLAKRQLTEPVLLPWKDLKHYFTMLERIRAKVQIVPLASHAFNHCKSNIAWIEASRVGSVTVAPDWAEWRRPGILNYRSGEQFVELVKKAYTDFEFMREQNRLSWEYIEANLRLSKVNQMRYDLLEGLL